MPITCPFFSVTKQKSLGDITKKPDEFKTDFEKDFEKVKLIVDKSQNVAYCHVPKGQLISE